MMGRQQDQQNKLFYTRLNIDQRIRKDHLLRQINQHIDFAFVYNEVKDARHRALVVPVKWFLNLTG